MSNDSRKIILIIIPACAPEIIYKTLDLFNKHSNSSKKYKFYSIVDFSREEYGICFNKHKDTIISDAFFGSFITEFIKNPEADLQGIEESEIIIVHYSSKITTRRDVEHEFPGAHYITEDYTKDKTPTVYVEKLPGFISKNTTRGNI